MKYTWAAVGMLTLLTLSACGGGGGDTPDNTAPGAVVSTTVQTLDASGGTLALQGLSLALPAAALSASTELSLQQETVDSPALARFRFSPAGQVLTAPAELRYSAANLPANARFFWEVNGERWMIPGTVSGGVLSSRVTSLGYSGAGSVQLARAQAASLGGRLQAAAERMLPMATSPSEGGSVVVAPVDCDAHITVLKTRLARAAADGDQERAVGVFNDLQATQEACVTARIQELERASCEASARAQANAQVLIANSLTAFSELTVPLFATQAFVENTSATCTSGDPAANAALIEAKFDQLLDVMKGQMARAEFDDALTVRDLGVVMHLETLCQRLELDAVCNRLTTELYPDLLDALRAAAFEECRVNATPLAVSQFYALGSRAGDPAKFFNHGRFSLAAVEADLSYCRDPSLGLRVFDGEAVPGELTDRASTIRPLVALGNYQKTRAIEVPRDGSLNIAGSVGVLRCPNGTASAADLVVRINGREWVRRAASGNAYPLESAPLLLDLPRVLPGLGIDPTTSTGFTVRVNREGGACSDGEQAVLDTPFTLFELNVNLPALPPSRFELVAKAGGGQHEKTECVKDTLTGLVWEGKPLTGSRAASNTYTNIANAAQALNLGAAVVTSSGNSVGYMNHVNGLALCGHTDWRIPTREELATLRSTTDDTARPYIVDREWHPNVQDGYWSVSDYSGSAHRADLWLFFAWTVQFVQTLPVFDDLDRPTPAPLRLVR